MNPHSYTYSGPSESFETLATLLESTIINDTIAIPERKGSGHIKKMQACKGLHVHIWDIQLNDLLMLQRSSGSAARNTLSLFYVFSPEHFVIASTEDSTGHTSHALKNLVLASEGIPLDFLVKPGHPVRMIQLDITREWLDEEYSHLNEANCPAYTGFLKTDKPVLFTEMASLDTSHTFSALLSHLRHEDTDPFYAKAKALSLLCDIFILLERPHEPLEETNMLVHEKMLAVEKVLDSCLETTLPSIGIIAKQMAMSESTLKRNFKQVYGTSIYEYYLQKKMKMARQLFAERPIPVKEVAYRLGYEKVSNFIQMFKKYYHFSPGRLKKTAGFMESSEKQA